MNKYRSSVAMDMPLIHYPSTKQNHKKQNKTQNEKQNKKHSKTKTATKTEQKKSNTIQTK